MPAEPKRPPEVRIQKADGGFIITDCCNYEREPMVAKTIDEAFATAKEILEKKKKKDD
jgi:predicted RNase H-like HicB family nuclease